MQGVNEIQMNKNNKKTHFECKNVFDDISKTYSRHNRRKV